MLGTMLAKEDGTNYPNYLNGCKFQISQNYLLSQYTATADKTQEHLSSLQKCPEWSDRDKLSTSLVLESLMVADEAWIIISLLSARHGTLC